VVARGRASNLLGQGDPHGAAPTDSIIILEEFGISTFNSVNEEVLVLTEPFRFIRSFKSFRVQRVPLKKEAFKRTCFTNLLRHI
jgi:hypothetical protein